MSKVLTTICLAADPATLTVLAGTGIFLLVTVLLVILLLIAKKFMVKSGDVNININDETDIAVPAGGSLLSALATKDVYLPSACGGKGSCGQCRVQVMSGGGDILPTETVHFTRREVKDHWRLGCQVKVKDNLKTQDKDRVKVKV